MKNLFFIITPIQYLNALEYLSLLDNNDDNILILASSFHTSRNEIKKMLNVKLWKEVFWLSEHKGSLSVIQYLSYIYQSKKKIEEIMICYDDFDRLIIGNYNDLLNHFVIQYSKHNCLVLVDDGLASLSVASKRYREINENNSILYQNKKQKIRPFFAKKILRLNKFIPPKITFFSSYKLKQNPSDVFVKNKYELIRKGIKDKKHNQTAYFIGQPLTELKILDEQYYLDILNRTKNKYNDKTIIYIPHRTENHSKLARINQIIPVKPQEIPIEQLVLQEQEIPELFISIYSSALINLRLIFQEEFKYIIIKIHSEQIKKNKDSILGFYEYIENEFKGAFIIENGLY